MLVALALRVAGLGRKSIWFDEAASVGFAALPLPDVLRATANDVNPPLYYVLLHVWLPVAGNSELLLRLPSALFSAAAVAVTYVLGRDLFGRQTAIVAAALTALCAWHIDLGQEARGYGLLSCLAMASLWLLWRALQRPTWRRWLWFALVTALALYTHNYAAFLVLAELAFISVVRGWSRRALVSVALVGVLFAPWLPVVVGQLGVVRGDYWIEPPSSTVVPDTYFAAIAYTPSAHGWGMSVLDRAVRWGIPVLLALALLSPAIGRVAARARAFAVSPATGDAAEPSLQTNAQRANVHAESGVLLLALAVGLTVALPIAISAWLTPIYVVRYVAFVLPAFWLLVARGIDVLPTGWLRAAVAASLLLELAINLPPLYADPFYGRADLRAAAATVQSLSEPGATVVHASAFTQYPFALYDHAQLLDTVIPDDQSATLPRTEFWYVRDYALQDPSAADAADEQARAVLDGRTLLRQIALPGVHLYQIAPAEP